MGISWVLIAIVLVLALAYLVWWGLRFAALRKAISLAQKSTVPSAWTIQIQEDLLESLRLISPQSEPYEMGCLALAVHNVDDARARVLLERYFETHNLSTRNAEVARWLAYLLVNLPVDERSLSQAGNAAGLLDALVQANLNQPADDRLRAHLAMQEFDTSPNAIRACLRVWPSLRAEPEYARLTRFLFDCFNAAEDLVEWDASIADEMQRGAAAVYCAMADVPPADLNLRRQAVQAASRCGDDRATFDQASRARDEFGAPALDDVIWRGWASSIIRMESHDWPAFSQRNFAALPQDTPWTLLIEILDHAAALDPENVALLSGQAWAYLGAKLTVERALPVFERVLEHELPITGALAQLAQKDRQTHQWQRLERGCRLLLPLQDEAAQVQTRRWIAEAELRGKLPLDLDLFVQVFNHDPSYAELNEALALHLLEQKQYTVPELDRMGRLLNKPFPRSFTAAKQQTLRESYILACLHHKTEPAELDIQVERYLGAGGAQPEVMRWAASHAVGSQQQQVSVLESLVERRPVERQHCLDLMTCYRALQPSPQQLARLAQAAEDLWKNQRVFDHEDVRLAQFLDQYISLSSPARKKLFLATIQLKPQAWREQASQELQKLLEQDQADEETLEVARTRLFSAKSREPLWVWVLEKLLYLHSDWTGDGLRLMELYDAGLGHPGEGDVLARAQEMAEELSKRCLVGNVQQANLLFPALFSHVQARGPAPLSAVELELLLYGAKSSLLPTIREARSFIEQVVDTLVQQKDERAVVLQRWVYDHSSRNAAESARLFGVARHFNQVETGDGFWFDVVQRAREEQTSAKQADQSLVDELLTRQKWAHEHLLAAAELLKGAYRAQIAPVFVRQMEYGRDRALDKLVLELLDERPELGQGRADLLLPLAEKRARAHNQSGALEIYLLAEESVGSSEDLTRRILAILPQAPNREQYAHRLAEYLKRYRNSFDLLSQMVTLARDPAHPLPFDLAFAIVDRWGDLAVRQDSAQAEYAADAGFVVTTKCELYENYREQMAAVDAQAVLRSIHKHSRQALSEEARRRVQRIGDEVLFSSGNDAQTRQLVAELLYGLGDLAAAVWHFEQLAELEEQHTASVDALKQISRLLENPRREPAALLAVYRVVAQDAHRAGQLDAAEAALQKAKAILLDEDVQEEMSEDERKNLLRERDPLLKLYQALLEAMLEKNKLSVAQRRDLADVYRLRGLWDRAGRLYSEVAQALLKDKDDEGALEAGEQVFACYYKAGKGWWELAARYLLRILWGRESVPPLEVTADFTPRQLALLERAAVLYHSIVVDPRLNLDYARRSQAKRFAQQLYDRLPFEYVQQRDYVRRLYDDLRQLEPTILEPMDLVPHMRAGVVDLPVGSTYEKLDRLGDGEFAEVFKVRDVQSGKLYAMKLIKPSKGRDPKAVERFQREGTWLRELDHPNIVKCYDVGVQEERQFIIMDFVDGSTLDDLITRKRRELPLQRRIQVFLQVCSAVEYLHNQGFLHRDLHPGNVLVGGPNHEEVKLTDFGLATILDREGVGKSSRIHGRENYTSPEVYRGQHESDTFRYFLARRHVELHPGGLAAPRRGAAE